ncbi:integrase arm-type DNA-binding domain-containing protein [Pseudomonas sp. F1_0610]|uniref:tyrosine-type recombinase/integrase n=1 Tax=Pseudomonas sp. F1_0610 TaxID=3114284 RepID=UPI0039C1DE4C
MKRQDIKRRPLADTVIEKLETELKEYRELDGNGLYLRVQTNGNKSWQLRYKKPNGTWSWLGLGAYPKVTAALARTKANSLQQEIAAGNDPLLIKQPQEVSKQLNTKNTFEQLANEWLMGKRIGWSPITFNKALGALKLHVFPKLGSRYYGDIRPIEWINLLRSLEDRGIVDQAGRIRRHCRDIYDLAKVTGRADSNPIEGLHKFLQNRKSTNFPHVSSKELPALILAIRTYKGDPDISIGLQLISMLVCRPSELRCAPWTEFDIENAVWTIPAERMKRGREHIIPLPHQAIKLIKQLKQYTGMYSLLFPHRSRSTEPRSEGAFRMALNRLGFKGKQTSHGFRHIASTVLNENGFEENHIEAQLSHVKEGVAGVYNKAQYLEQRRVMMQWYADYLDSLV